MKQERIVTITLSPCIDKSTTVDRFVPEKKLKCSYPVLEAGGGGINVSKALKNFRTSSYCIYISGGYTGKILDNLVFHEDLHAAPVHSQLFTRENFIVFENKTHLQFRFGMPVNKVSAAEWKQVINELNKHQADFVVLSGSIHSEVDKKFYDQLNAYVKRTGAKLVADTAGIALKHILENGAFLIKPNQNEFSGFYGKKILNREQIVVKARKLVSSGKIENVLVSLGGEGAVLVTKSGAWQFMPPKVKVRSTVGAGDSMVAGIVFQLEKGKSMEEAVKFGIACGTATTANTGMQLCSLQDAVKLTSKVKVIQL